MVFLKSRTEIDKLKEAGKIVAEVLDKMADQVRPGVSTMDLDTIAERVINSYPDARAAFKGYGGFPGTLCTSINCEVVHGIPSKDKILEEGDIVSVDCGVVYKGYFGDSARTYPVGSVTTEVETLLDVTQKSLQAGIEQARVGNRIGDIGFAVQKVAEGNGYSVVRDLFGHGIGQNLHEDPQVPNYGRQGSGYRIREGLVIAIEPMVNQGTESVFTLDDNWTVVTADKKLSAHFEHTVAVGPNGPEIMTLP